MMIPAIIAGAAGLGAIGSYMGQQEASKASKRAVELERDIIAQALEAIRSGVDPTQLDEVYNVDDYTPEELTYMEGYEPEAYRYLGDAQASMIQDSPLARAIQLDALGQLQGRVDEGLTAKDRAQFMLSQMRSGEAARGREEAIMESLQARGLSGSGIEASLRQQANQDAIERLAMEQAMQAEAAAQARAQATGQLFSAGGQLRSADIGLSQSNADILNKFAVENSRREQEIANMNISQRNKYLQGDVEERRAIAAQNVAARNEAQMLRQEQQRRNIRDTYSAQVQKAKLEADAIRGGIATARAEGAAEAAGQRAMWQGITQAPASVLSPYLAYKAATNSPKTLSYKYPDYTGGGSMSPASNYQFRTTEFND